jgi:uncharacterized protein YegL
MLDRADSNVSSDRPDTRERPAPTGPLRLGSVSLTKKGKVYKQRYVDLAFAVDISSSMHGSKFREAIAGLDYLTQSLLPLDDHCQIGVIAFNDTARLAHPLTSPKQLEGRIDIGRPNGATNMDAALRLAGDLFTTHEVPNDADQLIALLSDGQDTCSSSPIEEAARQKADGRLILTIAYGADADHATLRKIASSPDLFFAKGANGHELDTFLKHLGDTMTASVQIGESLSRSLSRIS